jgi:nucleoside-diphosphate-sugar epimerase
MRIFLAGGTGAVGRPLLELLIGDGHDVVVLTRSEERARMVSNAGADPVLGDAMDRPALHAAVLAAKPDVVIDQMTSLPQRVRIRGMRAFYKKQAPLREMGSGALLRAAEAAGAKRLIAQSVAFIYAPDTPGLKSENARIWSDGPAPIGPVLAGAAAHDERVVGTRKLEGVVLRYGVFYGPGTHFAAGNGFHHDVMKRRLPIVGSGLGRWSLIHVADAARACLVALDTGDSGIYNLVDDEPASVSDWLPVYARAIGAPKPRRLPRWLVRPVAGPAMTAWLTQLPGASNRKAKETLGWAPGYPSWRQGFFDSHGDQHEEPVRQH